MSIAGAVLPLAAVGVAAAVLALLPRRATRARWRRLLRETKPLDRAPSSPDLAARSGRFWAGRRWLARARRSHGANPTLPPGRRILVVALTAAVAAFGGLLVAGVVAGAVLAVYGATAASLALRVSTQRTESRSRTAAMDAVAALSAELRAGLAVGVALADAERFLTGPAVVGSDAALVARRVYAAIEVAESSGAALADVLDRLDAHLRTADRARASAAAQAAGARASALLLAAMPVAGAGLGFLVGIDPLHTLLHTPIGAGCLAGAVVLQLGGLAWSARISRVEVAL